jgi:carnitine-CoA ligase
VISPHSQAHGVGRSLARHFGYRPDDVLYTCLPLFHGNAQLLTFMTGVVSGAAVALGARFSVSGFWPDVLRHGATQFNYIGTILTLLLKGEPGADEGHRLRLGWGAGANADVWRVFEDRFGIRVSEAYGMTENGMVLYSPPDAPRHGSCGKPIAMADVVVANDDDEPVEPGVVGQILTRPRRPFTMMLGYHRMPEQTLASFRNLWFHTGDAAYADADGYVYFVDRVKDAIRRRGENISSFEVEQIVNSFPGVVESAAIPVPSELGEDDVMVCLVPRGRTEEFAVAGLFAFCREEMPAFMVPRYVRVLETLPKTPTERVEKYKLRSEGVTADTWDAETLER